MLVSPNEVSLNGYKLNWRSSVSNSIQSSEFSSSLFYSSGAVKVTISPSSGSKVSGNWTVRFVLSYTSYTIYGSKSTKIGGVFIDLHSSN